MHSARRLGVLAAIAAALGGAIAAAPAAGSGGALIPTGVYGGDGVVGPVGGRDGEYRYVTLGYQHTTVLRISTAGGAIDQYRPLEGSWALPAVTAFGEAGGLSADGRSLVLVDPSSGPTVRGRRAGETRLRILDARSFDTRTRLTLDGTYSFDAISPDGRLLYLVEYANPRDPLDYRVRAYDLRADRFRPGAVVDPSEPDEQMTGQPVSRAHSADGRWAYTLYVGGDETFIHALDTARATAVCVDLDSFDPRDAFTLRLDVDPASGTITVLDRRDPVATVDPRSWDVAPLGDA